MLPSQLAKGTHTFPLGEKKYIFTMNTPSSTIRLFTLALALAAAFCLSSRAAVAGDFFSGDSIILKENQLTKIRGIINVVYLPLPDDLELGKHQSGYFLFTANAYDMKITGEEGETEHAKNQQMFHLTLSDEQIAKVEKLLQKPVELTAEPFEANTRHHRTPVLLSVKSIKPLSVE